MLKLKLFLLSLLLVLVGAVPASADWQRGIDGAGADLSGNNLTVNDRYRSAYFHMAAASTTDSSWLTIPAGTRVRIMLNTNTGSATQGNSVTVNVKLLTHVRSDVTKSLNDSVTLINLTMSATEDQFYDLDGEASILIDPQVAPAVNGAYVSVIVQNPPEGD